MSQINKKYIRFEIDNLQDNQDILSLNSACNKERNPLNSSKNANINIQLS